MTGEEMSVCEVPDKLAMFSYLTNLYEAFKGEIPHIKHFNLVRFLKMSYYSYFLNIFLKTKRKN